MLPVSFVPFVSFVYKKFILPPGLAIATFMFACDRPPVDPGRIDPPEIVEAFGFSKGLHPVLFSPATEAVRAKKKRINESRECRACHETVYDNWYASRHRVAFSNPLYKESHAREPSRWCVNCHAPLVDRLEASAIAKKRAQRKKRRRPHTDLKDPPPIQAADGISCVVCHVRKGKMITGSLPEAKADASPQGTLAHDYHIVPAMKSAEFCGSCHQFNFLTAATSPPESPVFAYSDQPMQDTLREWRISSYARHAGMNCQTCHLAAGSAASHRFPGGHALEDLARAIGVEARAAGAGRLEVRVYTQGIGHAFPTGDLFRALRVKLFTADGRPVKELIFKKRFARVTGNTDDLDPEAAPKRLVSDDTIPPPAGGDFVSSKTTMIAWPVEGDATQTGAEFRYEMYMDYLEPTNHLLTRLPLAMTSPMFKQGRARIRPADETFAY